MQNKHLRHWEQEEDPQWLQKQVQHEMRLIEMQHAIDCAIEAGQTFRQQLGQFEEGMERINRQFGPTIPHTDIKRGVEWLQ